MTQRFPQPLPHVARQVFFVLPRLGSREFHAPFPPLDPDDFPKPPGHPPRKKSRPAIRIDQERPTLPDRRVHGVKQQPRNPVVRLMKSKPPAVLSERDRVTVITTATRLPQPAPASRSPAPTPTDTDPHPPTPVRPAGKTRPAHRDDAPSADCDSRIPPDFPPPHAPSAPAIPPIRRSTCSICPRFISQLRRIRHVLIDASPARPEIRTRRLHPRRRHLQQAIEPGLDESLTDLLDDHARAFPRDDVRHEHRFTARQSPHSLAAERDIIDLHHDRLPLFRHMPQSSTAHPRPRSQISPPTYRSEIAARTAATSAAECAALKVNRNRAAPRATVG